MKCRPPLASTQVSKHKFPCRSSLHTRTHISVYVVFMRLFLCLMCVCVCIFQLSLIFNACEFGCVYVCTCVFVFVGPPVRSYLGTCPLASAYLYYVDGLESQKQSVISKSYITVCECVNTYVCVVLVCALMIRVPMCEKHQHPHTHVNISTSCVGLAVYFPIFPVTSLIFPILHCVSSTLHKNGQSLIQSHITA